MLFYQMRGQDCLSRLFEYNLEFLSEKQDIEPQKILGEPICIRIETANGDWRYFHGHVSRFGQSGHAGVYASYHATVRPWLWFLTRASNCRVFQNKSVPDIIKQVFQSHGFSDFDKKLNGTYAPREYCVQYRETDFDFISRLLEEEGIYYYFQHEKDKHQLILIDSVKAHPLYPGYENIPYRADNGVTNHFREDHIYNWGVAHEVQLGAYELTDYDFEKPKASLLVKSLNKNSHSHAEYAFFDFPGKYTETGHGENYVRQRIEEHHSRFERCEGKCTVRGMAVGHRFTLQEFPRRDQNREYLVIAANYHLTLDGYFSGSASTTAEKFFDCSFTVQDAKCPYRPEHSTPKPAMRGAQTAVVTGPAGQEIYTDKYGRVKVQFHWDRYGKKDQDSSCWVRVSQPWAGKNWGMIAIPRIGQEVIVDFLEGDPDQPIITGSVYNADMMPPFALPGAAVVSGIKSNTHKGKGYNEMTMDDTAGKEKITIHAQYDMNTTVEHDQSNTIKNNRTTAVTVDDTLTVNANRTMHIKGTLAETIDTGHQLTVKAGLTENISDGHSVTVKGGVTEDVTGGQTLTVKGAINQSSTDKTDLHADGAGTYTSNTSLQLAVQGSVIDITPQAITISVGGSTIKIDPAGVSITAPKISLNG